jgi:hypothetical protein
MTTMEELQKTIAEDDPYAKDLIEEELAFAQELRRIGEPQHAAAVMLTAIHDIRRRAFVLLQEG